MSSSYQNACSAALTQSQRVIGLDQLRGSLAFIVMIYHLIHWEEVKSGGSLYRALDMAGLYFVSSFYILSGIAMMLAYGRKSFDVRMCVDFAVKRFFRIMPLFWLVTGIAVVHIYIKVIPVPFNYNITNLVLSITGLFSWVQPRAYFSAGMWSIGNELAFYSLLPVFLYLLKYKVVFVLSVIVGIVSSFIWSNTILAGHVGTSFQWSTYIHPFNQLCFFSSGLMVGWALNENHLPASRLQHGALLMLGVVLFCLVSNIVRRDQVVVGLPKLMLLMICITICVGATGFAATGFMGRALEWLGNISYSLYLLHWPVYLWIQKFALHGKDAFWIIVSTILASIVVSSLSFRYIETPFLLAGKWVSRLIYLRCHGEAV